MTIPLRDIMVRLSTELHRATDLAVAVEETLDHGRTLPSQDLRHLQNLDLLTQTLADLARFVQALAPELPAVTVQAGISIEQVTLRGLADRLVGANEDRPDTLPSEVSYF